MQLSNAPADAAGQSPTDALRDVLAALPVPVPEERSGYQSQGYRAGYRAGLELALATLGDVTEYDEWEDDEDSRSELRKAFDAARNPASGLHKSQARGYAHGFYDAVEFALEGAVSE